MDHHTMAMARSKYRGIVSPSFLTWTEKMSPQVWIPTLVNQNGSWIWSHQPETIRATVGSGNGCAFDPTSLTWLELPYPRESSTMGNGGIMDRLKSDPNLVSVGCDVSACDGDLQRFYYKTWIMTLEVIYNATFREGCCSERVCRRLLPLPFEFT